jgi:hypothetical protein
MHATWFLVFLTGVVPGLIVGVAGWDVNERSVAFRVVSFLLLIPFYLFGALGWGQPHDVRREPGSRFPTFWRALLHMCGVFAGCFAGGWLAWNI